MNNQQKQQVIEEIKNAKNVLIAVSANPTVDELSASVGLTLALNKMDKHATTVFSGVVPSTIEFLQPEKTIETTTDSLRDFIIALDKTKADKLRYKVEDDFVRIFITPYKTSITDKDLEFSQGDFNVDVVVAMGVTKREDLDRAITAHGRILHDATVIALTKQDDESQLGSINWQEKQATSLCEMAASITIEMKADVLDGQMATSYLTGIIAETDRFRNERTTPAVLALSSKLMTAGANQQLIAEKLEEPEISKEAPFSLQQKNEDESSQPEQQQASVQQDGTLEIDHTDDVDKIHIDDDGNLQIPDEDEEPIALESELEPEEEPEPTVQQQYSPDMDEDKHVVETDEKQDEQEAEPTNTDPANPMPTMTHGKTIMPSEDSELAPKSDKPFDLKEAMESSGLSGDTNRGDQPEVSALPTPAPPAPMPSLPDDNLATTEQYAEPAVEENPSPAPLVPSPTPQVPSVQLPPPAVEERQSRTAPPPGTLASIEEAVGSSHVQADKVDNNILAAQDAVQSAASEPSKFPVANQAIGSTPLPLRPPSTDPTPEPMPKVNAPPPVPPPMTPQFFDNDGTPGSSSNPFLNPSSS